MKRTDLKQLRDELAPGFMLVPVPRRHGRFFIEGPDGERLKLNPDRSDRPMVVGGASTPGSYRLMRAMLAKQGALR